jgi:hypothetical protein
MIASQTMVSLLAFSAMFLAILMPPEAFPAGGMAVLTASTFSFLIALVQRKIPSAYLIGGAALFTFLLLHSVLVSVDRGRSFEFLPVIWTYYCLLGYFKYTGFDSRTHFAGAIVALSAIVSCYGLYQYFWGFEQLYNYVFYSGSDEIVKTPALTTIESARVFSTLALPGTLWGFLVMALPLHAVLWKRNRLLDGALLVSAALLLACGSLTRSFGFLVGLFVLAACALIIPHRKALRSRVFMMAGIILILVTLGSAFYSMREEMIERANPFSLRFKNWIGAWNVFAVHPLGTGLNTFAVAYPKFMQPDANETQYAHNTPLQVMSELGYASVLAFMVLVIFLAHTYRVSGFPAKTKYFAAALAVWCIHNLIDINVYFPSIGVVGAALTGMILARPPRECTPPRSLAFATAAIAICALAAGSLAFVSSELQHRAEIEIENGRLPDAVATLATAMKFNPLNSSFFHVTGEISLELFHRTQDPQRLQSAKDAFQRAIELSPLKVGPHIGLGLCLSTSNDMEGAMRQIQIAQQLYPGSSYVRSVEQLMQKRVQGGFPD